MNQSIIKRVAITAAAAFTLGWATAGLADVVKPVVKPDQVKKLDPNMNDKLGDKLNKFIRAVCAEGFTANPAMLDKNQSILEQPYQCIGPVPSCSKEFCAITKQSFDGHQLQYEYKCATPVPAPICIDGLQPTPICAGSPEVSIDNNRRIIYSCVPRGPC